MMIMLIINSKHNHNTNEHILEDNAEGISYDPSQEEAMLNMLRRPISITQGPPGTGKTFIGLNN